MIHHYFSRIARGLSRVGDARLRELGFATAQWPVLSMLKDGAARSQTDLARLAKVEQPTMAQLLGRMERDGLIHREPDPADRRSSLISLTDAARAKLPAGQAVLKQGNVDMTRGTVARGRRHARRPVAEGAGQRRGYGDLGFGRAGRCPGHGDERVNLD
jgi:MarR family transcriptional regulator, transcriptional regulator for hemolysin